MKPLVSILIPAYNAEKWIAETLRSALAQTWPSKEIILVDDGSKDRTLEIARQFEAQGVRVVSQQNEGAAAARNKAFSLSRGEYIQWLDADDLLSPDKIALQMEAAETLNDPRLLLSCAWGRFMYRPERAKFLPSPLWSDLSAAEWLIIKMGKNFYMPPTTWLCSRAVTVAAGPWNTQMFVDDDGEYFCRVLLASHGVRFVQKAEVYYRATGFGSLSFIGRSDRKMSAQWRSMELHVHYMLSLEDSPRSRSACVRHLQNWSSCFYPDRMDLMAKARTRAKELGGNLKVPNLPWKYALIHAILGPQLAKRAQIALPRLRWSTVRSWDRVRSQFFRGSRATACVQNPAHDQPPHNRRNVNDSGSI